MQGTIAAISRETENYPVRSAWGRGVRSYVEEFFEAYMTNKGLRIDDTDARIGKITDADLLNGAKDWSQYSYVRCADICDADICERLCCPSEAKKKSMAGCRPMLERPGWTYRRGHWSRQQGSWSGLWTGGRHEGLGASIGVRRCWMGYAIDLGVEGRETLCA
ncbi:MAG: hypothetical protein HFG59_10985 [Lachnospiraceae bacterium]|nr:hypothetical protein [Lachnospiraceae bacterium]